MKKSQKPVVIATWKHGYKASKEAYRVVNSNGNALDAVEKGVRTTESDPEVRTVGYGGYTDQDGYVTLDASIMDHLGNAGSVAYLKEIKHPISVARKVMERSDHVMLVGLGAQKFAFQNGFKKENVTLITDEEATKENILDAFSDILEIAKEKDRVVVFYAGHGETYKLPSGGDMGYLIPVDGNIENLYRSSIPMKSVYDIAEMSYAKHILYLVDACMVGLRSVQEGLKKIRPLNI